jgi:alpha-galactosidase
MTKVAIIGAGSGFGGRLSVDTLARKPLQDATIALCDLHPERLAGVKEYVELTIEAHKLPARVEASMDRKEILKDADFVVTSVSVGGPAYWCFPFSAEIEIPQKYGIHMNVSDTTSAGAVFRFLRTAPVHLQIFRDIERLAPNALVLNHTNPMAMLTWIHHAATSVRNVGLCHGVQGTSRGIAERLEIPYEEMSFICAGINHLAWFLELKRGDEDLYPELKRRMGKKLDEFHKAPKGKTDAVRFELLRQFGYFPTEGSEHDSEYVPYFRNNPETREAYALDAWKVSYDPPKRRVWAKDTGIDEDDGDVAELKVSNEYSSGIMEAVVTNQPYQFNGNVMNDGLITNLPQGSCVEVPCTVDARGIHPERVGDLPKGVAALCRSNISVHDLAVEAVLNRDKEAAFHAVACCPVTSSILSLPKIREMFDEMWEAEKDLLTYFKPGGAENVPETFSE